MKPSANSSPWMDNCSRTLCSAFEMKWKMGATFSNLPSTFGIGGWVEWSLESGTDASLVFLFFLFFL